VSAAKAKPVEKPSAGAKKPAPARSRALARWTMLALLVVGATSSGLYLLWQMVAPHVLAGVSFDPKRLEVVPEPPGWIHSDLKAEVVRDGSLDGALSLLDEGLAERVYKAFALHPWVAKVVRVTKQDTITVELVYRKPVLMVEVPGGLYPVDEEGVLLPTKDFSALEARGYPRLTGIQTVTEGPVGTRWQDSRVAGAAQLAAALIEDWNALNFRAIVPVVGMGRSPNYELHTRKGTRILWGAANSSSTSAEPSVAEKLARLKRYVADRGSLEGPNGPQVLDLHSGKDIIAMPHMTAAPANEDQMKNIK
jgi:hypothetical protein